MRKKIICKKGSRKGFLLVIYEEEYKASLEEELQDV